jgi:hypothetical protein
MVPEKGKKGGVVVMSKRKVAQGGKRAEHALLDARLQICLTSQERILTHLERTLQWDQQTAKIISEVIGHVATLRNEVDAGAERQRKMAQVLMAFAARADEEYDAPDALLELLRDTLPEVAVASPKRRRQGKRRANGK